MCIFGETVMYAEQTKVLPKHAIRFNSGIWVGRCTISNAHLVVDDSKLFRTRTVRRFPEGSERRNHETLQRFAVNVTNPISIPDVPTKKRRDVSEHDEMDERLNGYYKNLTSNRFRSFRFYTNQSSMQLEQEDSMRNWYRRR